MESNQVSYGRVLGATLLVAGCCIGAGMLGLPVLTALGGFMPTIILFALGWLFMAGTGLLFLEVNLWFPEEVSFISMAGATLGWVGKVMGWLLFTFLFYSLMVAYAAGSGQLIADFVRASIHITIPEWVGALGLSIIFGIILFLGTAMVDFFNRVLMVGLIVTYFVLIGIGGSYVNTEFLKHSDWSRAIYAVPAIIISFGFHNLVPSLTTYLKHDVNKLRFAILVGSSIPLLTYVLWEWVLLGMVPVDGGFREALDHGDMATRVLRQAVGSSWIVDLAEYFAFFAIVTTFLSVALGFVDFLADGLHVKKDGKGKVLLCVLSLAPPFVLSLLYPGIFLKALSYAGAFGAVLLFGIMPAAMVWSGRYVKRLGRQTLLPGGRVTLVVVILCSLAVVALEIIH